MLVDYIPIAILFILAAAVAALMIGIGVIFGPRRKSFRKQSPYESGMQPIGPGTRRMNVRYYLVAVLFILFDVELVFLYPWAVVYRALGGSGLVEMVIFLAVLMAGFFYAWDNGALDWQ